MSSELVPTQRNQDPTATQIGFSSSPAEVAQAALYMQGMRSQLQETRRTTETFQSALNEHRELLEEKDNEIRLLTNRVKTL